MTAIPLNDAVGQLLDVLAEAFEGPKNDWSYFTDQGAQSGLLGTLEVVSAPAASRVWGGTTIAAHAHHAQFAVAASAAWIAGDRSARNWQESWSVNIVDEQAWKRLRQRLREGYADLRKAISSHASGSAESFAGAVAAVAHAAYHLGAIRQKIAAARSVVVSEAIAQRGWTRDELHERHPKE